MPQFKPFLSYLSPARTFIQDLCYTKWLDQKGTWLSPFSSEITYKKSPKNTQS